MTKRCEFAGTHYSRNKSVMAATGLNDDIIVMYVNQDKIFEGDIIDLKDAILTWLKTDKATISNKYSLVEWCNSFGDPMFEDSDELPKDEDLADTVSWLIERDYRDSTGRDFYVDGMEYLNMEVFPKSAEIE